MKQNKGFISIGLILAVILGMVAAVGTYYLEKNNFKKEIKIEENNLSNNENQNNNSSSINASSLSDSILTTSDNSITSCTSDKGNVMTYNKALEISKTSSCNNIGSFNGKYSCNKNGGGLVDVYMEPTNKPGCSFACRVSIDTGKTEEGWMCTGLLKPTTELPAKYLDSQNWPPVVKTSGFAYSCKLSSGSGDVPTVVVEKTINGKKYCITSLIDAGAGSRFGEYTYTTPSTSGSGTKTASFNLRWSSCGGYGAPGEVQYDECMSIVSTFLNRLDEMVDSLMK